MTNTANVKTHWTLIAFAKMHDSKMAVVKCTNSETGQEFEACAFGADRDHRVFASIGPSIKGWGPSEIAANKDNLQVVEWDNPETEKHGYTLCKQGNSDNWRVVDLGL